MPQFFRGVSGGLANSNSLLNTPNSQQWNQPQQAQYSANSFSDCTITPAWSGFAASSGQQALASLDVRQTKVSQQMNQLVTLLPTHLAVHVSRVDFQMYGGCRFVVYFDDGKIIDFTNINDFPTSEDVARIALECP